MKLSAYNFQSRKNGGQTVKVSNEHVNSTCDATAATAG